MAEAKKSKKSGRNSKCKIYKLEDRRLKNKARKLAKRWKNYKIQPPKALKGLNNNIILKFMVEKNLKLNA